MVDLDHESPNLTGFNVVQLKFDGWWTLLKIEDHRGILISSGGEVRATYDRLKLKQALIICEWIYGTNWAQTSYFKNSLIGHDVLELDNTNFENQGYWYRWDRFPFISERLNNSGINFSYAEKFRISDWKEIWDEFVIQHGYEGLVFKDDLRTFDNSYMGRMKPNCREEYVVMGYNEGKNRLTGTLGSIIGGMYVNGILTKICTVGGGFTDEQRDEIWANREKYIGRVFEAEGKVKFKSGALRHPAFLWWRDDKDPRSCILG